MKVRIGADNSCERVVGLPTPRLDLVFEKDDSQARIYFVKQGEGVPEYGAPPPYLRVTISDLAAVVAALREPSMVTNTWDAGRAVRAFGTAVCKAGIYAD